MEKQISSKYFKTSPEIIQLAVMYYVGSMASEEGISIPAT